MTWLAHLNARLSAIVLVLAYACGKWLGLDRDLRRLLAKALGNRFSAFAAGIALTALLQSSTATALITSSFAAEGLVGLVEALAIMLGANVGTTLIVQVLSFNIAAGAPARLRLMPHAIGEAAHTRLSA